jgi:hypothetical protein
MRRGDFLNDDFIERTNRLPVPELTAHLPIHQVSKMI